MPATATRRDQQRRQRGENRARIVAAAEEQLRHKPFRDVSIDEVMQAAGLTRTIFYRHFDDLPDLLMKVAGSAFEELYASIGEIAVARPADEATLRSALGGAIDAFVVHGPLVRAIAEAAHFDEEVERLYEAVFDRYVEFTAEALRAGGAHLADPGQTARALTHMNVAYLIDMFGREPKTTAGEALDTIVAVWLAVLRG